VAIDTIVECIIGTMKYHVVYIEDVLPVLLLFLRRVRYSISY
jgi:hypothetical protein